MSRQLDGSRTATGAAGTLAALAAALMLAPPATADTPDLEGYWGPARGAGGARMPETITVCVTS